MCYRHLILLHIDNPVVWGETPLQTMILNSNCWNMNYLNVKWFELNS
jgi:hypothetical protein